ncbi:MAG: hypothetical protein ACFFA8_03935 [Promethearchaeota archaeon]
MTEEHVICKNCILVDGFLGIHINDNGLCDFCSDPNHKNPNWSKIHIDYQERKDAYEDWKRVVNSMQKNHNIEKYDCVIGYSGGKDSTALVDTFINEYNLKPFLITVDTSFMTKIAKKNIRDTLKKMNLFKDHILIEGATPTFSKLYKHFFFHHQSNEKSLTVDICHKCTDLIHTIIIKEAIKRKIPYVIIGFSPDQIARYFYETPILDVIIDGSIPSQLETIYAEKDFKWYLTPKEISTNILPRVLYPYHVIEYDESEIIQRIESKGLIEIGKGDPVLTNCHVVKAALLYDMFRYGGVTYALQYAELIRQENDDEIRRKSRKDWLRLYKQIGKSIINGSFNVEGLRQFFEKLGLSKQELIEKIEQQRTADPNHHRIIKNIELIKANKLK